MRTFQNFQGRHQPHITEKSALGSLFSGARASTTPGWSAVRLGQALGGSHGREERTERIVGRLAAITILRTSPSDDDGWINPLPRRNLFGRISDRRNPFSKCSDLRPSRQVRNASLFLLRLRPPPSTHNTSRHPHFGILSWRQQILSMHCASHILRGTDA